jgi:hypothetical protein
MSLLEFSTELWWEVRAKAARGRGHESSGKVEGAAGTRGQHLSHLYFDRQPPGLCGEERLPTSPGRQLPRGRGGAGERDRRTGKHRGVLRARPVMHARTHARTHTHASTEPRSSDALQASPRGALRPRPVGWRARARSRAQAHASTELLVSRFCVVPDAAPARPVRRCPANAAKSLRALVYVRPLLLAGAGGHPAPGRRPVP